MLKICESMCSKIFDKFGYFPEASFDAVMEDTKASEEYCKVLQKCIDDDFDYTIELYGTIPKTSKGLPDIIVD